MQNKGFEIDLYELIYIFKRKWWIIVMFTLAMAIAAFFVTEFYLQPMYQAETTLFIGKEPDKIGGIELGDIQVNNQLVNDYREIIKSRAVCRSVIEALNLSMTIKEFQEMVNVTTILDSRLFKISFKSQSPKLAMDITNHLAQVLIQKAKEIVEVKNIRIIDLAELPTNPASPSMRNNVIIFGVFGLILGLAIATLVEFLHHTFRKAEDIERYLELNIIGQVPKFASEKRR